MKHLEVTDERIRVDGLYWWQETKPHLWRLPPRYQERVPEKVWSLAQRPTGARVRFRTNASALVFNMTWPNFTQQDNMSRWGAGGCDVWIDDIFFRAKGPGVKPTPGICWFSGIAPEWREVCVYLPTYTQMVLDGIEVDNKGEVLPPTTSYALDEPLVIYGTSITQGGCAGRASMTWPAILARNLNLDFINLGFSGAGRGEPVMAEILGTMDACAYIVDLGYNHKTAPEFAESFPVFLDILLAARPDVPIVCTSPTYCTMDDYSGNARLPDMRTITREVVQERQERGAKLSVVDGCDLIGPDDRDGIVDIAHLNDLGMQLFAERLEPTVTRAMGL